jgi:hypothetical protein
MPRKQTSDAPAKITFQFQPSQTRLLRRVPGKNGQGTYIQLVAPQNLEIGGQRSGKTLGKFMHGVIDYCLKFRRCDMLVLRRTTPELESIVKDLHTFVPESMYKYVSSPTRVATFNNGSTITFGSCPNDVERDIEKYLGQAFPYILVDECSQFSDEVWNRLAMRNLVNSGCQEDEHGNLPVPRIVGCSNPIGAHWDYYRTTFVRKKPYQLLEGARFDKDGRYWEMSGGDWVCRYNPDDYSYNHTTILDNAEYRKRHPEMIDNLNRMPKDLREIFLQGRLDGQTGQFFDCWTPDYVVRLREDPEAVLWQPWQPVIGGQDWGVGSRGHGNVFYLFTRALVRKTPQGDYRPAVICFREIAPHQSMSASDFADLINAACHYPKLPEDHPQYHLVSAKRCKVAAIAFSHEKFSRVMEQHSPADEYSRLLRERSLPPVSRATTDRIGSAAYMYNEMKMGRLFILDSCPQIIQAIPTLQRDDKHLDDVKKTSARADDCYDSFRYGLYMMFKERGMPQDTKDAIELDKLSPWQRHFRKMKLTAEAKKRKEVFVPPETDYWRSKL